MDSPQNSLMVHDEELLQDSRFIHVQRLKFAVAYAIIRSKPDDMSSHDYAKYLADIFSRNLENWKKKCETLEEEVLSLEQKLNVVQLRESNNMTALVTSDLLPNATLLNEDNHQHSFQSAAKLQQRVLETLDFVRSFVLLANVPCDAGGQQPEGRQNLKETLLKSVTSMLATLRGDRGLGEIDPKVVKQAVAEVHRVLDSRHRYCGDELVKVCLDFVDDVLLDVHRCSDINTSEKQHSRSFLLQMLAEHRSLTIPILSRILREITLFTDFLRSQTGSDVDDYAPLLKLENAYYVLQSAEGVVRVLKLQNSQLNAAKFSQSLLAEWEKTIRNSLLAVGSKFPMFSWYVWHIHDVLKETLVPIVVPSSAMNVEDF